MKYVDRTSHQRFRHHRPPGTEIEGAAALLGPGRRAFIERYKSDNEPATDDRPYFFHFFRWRTLPELVALKEQGGLPLLEWGYPVLIATLLQAVVASLVLIVLPLAIGGRDGGGSHDPARPSRAGVALYFAALGFAFMFVEIAFIKKFILFLAHPLYAVAVVLCAFLVFAGLGSRVSPRLVAEGSRWSHHPLAWLAGGARRRRWTARRPRRGTTSTASRSRRPTGSV